MMENHTIRVRRATGGDIDTIVDFNMAMAKETEGMDLPRQKLEKGVTAVFEDGARGFYIIAECNGKVVGQTMITYEWSDWRNGVFWWIQSVYVLPRYRQMGVFRSMFQHIKNMAKAASNVCGFRLYVDRDNHPAKRVYNSLSMGRSHYELYEIPLEEH